MANVPVPQRRYEPNEGLVRIGSPVSTATWQQLGALTNWLNGKGAELVPWCAPMRTILKGSGDTFRFYVRNRAKAIQRVWLVALRSISGATLVTLRSPTGTGTAQTALVTGGSLAVSPGGATYLTYVQNLTSQTATTGQIDIQISVAAGAAYGSSIVVEGIACYEQDRATLAQNTTDYGTDIQTVRSGQPMADFTFASVGGVLDGLTNCDPRRIGLWHWTQGDSTVAATSSGTPANLLVLGCPVLAQKLARAAVTGSVKWNVYARVTAGTGTVTLATSNSGVSDSFSITGTSFAWQTSRTAAVDCDDMASADGRQTSGSPAWDEVNIAISATGGTLTVQSVSLYIESL